jgi:large subunit ribosomal protein L10
VPTQEKIDVIEDLKERLHGVTAVVLAEYRGLTVHQLAELRKQLRPVSAQYKIVKNRLARIAIETSELQELRDHLKGPTGLIVAREDPVAVAKTLQTFARTNQAFIIKGGVVEGRFIGADGVKALAELPSKEALRSQLVGAVEGPLAQLVGLLRAPQRELAYVLAERGKNAGAE